MSGNPTSSGAADRAGSRHKRVIRAGDRADRRNHSGWQVDDLAAPATRGVAVERFGLPGQGADDIWTAPGGAGIAWFKDPDGNILHINNM